MFSTLKKGFDYAFGVNRQMRDDFAPRAGFVQFQTYPQNMVQGGGTLVGQNVNNAGKYWRVQQPPQVIQQHTAVQQSAIAGGTLAGGIIMQPLIDTSTAQG